MAVAGSDHVFVGCKMPAGVILNLRRTRVERANGMVEVVVEGDDIPDVRLKGTARKAGAVPIDIDGYVFTPVPAEFWNEWVKRNANSSLIKDGFIKPAKSMDDGRRIAREHEGAPGMFAPLVLDKAGDSADKFRTQAERVSRVAGLGVSKGSNKDD